jgi:hypothetical protein
MKKTKTVEVRRKRKLYDAQRKKKEKHLACRRCRVVMSWVKILTLLL